MVLVRESKKSGRIFHVCEKCGRIFWTGIFYAEKHEEFCVEEGGG